MMFAFNFQCGQVRVNGNVVSSGNGKLRKTDVVPGKFLAVGSPWNRRFCVVPFVVYVVRRFHTSTRAVCNNNNNNKYDINWKLGIQKKRNNILVCNEMLAVVFYFTLPILVLFYKICFTFKNSLIL